jgi:hypothetical protein
LAALSTMSAPVPVPKWTIEAVGGWLEALGLGALDPAFKANAVDGAMLVDLTDEEYTSSLGCTGLQVRARARRGRPVSAAAAAVAAAQA